ncbi:MAG: hypothetical protein JWQ09_4227, partial [Segetibacter sp.]|nr:hypothetical protein [Segetibacter sp.]
PFIIPASETQNLIPPIESDNNSTLSQQPATRNMEVHHHGHVHNEKKWKEYLFQFFMLFLAVFCGFLAEYMLEHRIEKERASTYIKSFYEDLDTDENKLYQVINSLSRQYQAADSLPSMLKNADLKKPANSIYFNLRRATRNWPINLYINDRTVVQLRNSGGMRLIENKSISDSIVAYYKEVDYIQYYQERLLTFTQSLRANYSDLLDGNAYEKVIDKNDQIIYSSDPLYLRSTDAKVINDCIIKINEIKGLCGSIRNSVLGLQQKAKNIKKFIAKEHQL